MIVMHISQLSNFQLCINCNCLPYLFRCTQGCGFLPILDHYFLAKNWFFLFFNCTNVYRKVIVPGRRTFKLVVEIS